ncbi:MAG: reverse transcriptase domain-containing protein, partial [Cetobacterium sp.]
EISWEPLSTVSHDKAVCGLYAREKGLLEEPGWKQFKRHAKRTKTLTRMVNQAKLHSYRTAPFYQHGYLVPRNHEQAMELDRQNGNTKWQDSEYVELSQIVDYSTFNNLGHYVPGPAGYKKITVHLVYAVKHDGRHKARLVAGGHLTETPLDSVYSSVASIRGIRMVMFLAELNDLQTWNTDIGNAYLESYTQEKLYIIAGKEFACVGLEGCTLVVVRALYGLKSSGLRWHELFADVMREMGFFPSKADYDIWMKEIDGDHYDYIVAYVDDLLIASKNPSQYTDEFQERFAFKLKGTGPATYHLGVDYSRDANGILCMAPRKYVDKLIDAYARMFGSKPKQFNSPLEHGDHPELDTSIELEIDDIKKYQTMIGSLQWVVQIGRFDITTAVMTLSSFRANPRQGHLDRAKRIYGYLTKMRNATIRIRTEEPDYSDLPQKIYDWEHSVYRGATELMPLDAPVPLGLPVVMTTYVDANLYHDLINGRSVTGIIHLFNKTPVDWYSKKQATVETATYGAEFVAARTAMEQIIDLRIELRYLGVHIKNSTMMFGDNES